MKGQPINQRFRFPKMPTIIGIYVPPVFESTGWFSHDKIIFEGYLPCHTPADYYKGVSDEKSSI